MAYTGTGTQDSPIAIDDSEDEVVQELEGTRSSPDGDVQYLGRVFKQTHEDPPVQKKRKRTSSFIEQLAPVAGPSHVPPMENRLSQPESKKARKRRRKLERQAAEEARLQGLGWLNNPIPFAPGLPQWPTQFPIQSVYIPSYPVMTNHAYPSMDPGDFYNFVGEEDAGYYNYPIPSPPLEGSASKWVSSMAMAVDPVDEAGEEALLPPLPPPTPPPPLPPPLARPPSPRAPLHVTDAPINKPMEHHPTPPMPIGMVPDPDPKSKRGTFVINNTMKEAGTDRHKRRRNYMPNPARTLVMENLPKTHRTSDFVNNWSRKACGALPVHVFIDTSGAKTLIEFSTAELARKAWNSPRLGSNVAGVKNFVKGQPREDLIRVWWYRVDGIGAGAGVGEIEEGEIEDDVADTPQEEGEHELPPPLPPPLLQLHVETKREKKARLAKEREEKKLRKEHKLRLLQEERQAFEQKLVASHEGLRNDSLVHPLPTNDFNPSATQGNTVNGHPLPAAPSLPLPPAVPPPAPVSMLPLPSRRPLVSGSSQPSGQSELGVYRTAFGSSLLLEAHNGHDDNDSIASSTGRRSPSPSAGPSVPVPASKFFVASTSGQGDDLDDYEEADMDVEVDDAPLPPPTSSLPLIPPLVHSLPPRPTPLIRAAKQRGAVQKLPLAHRQPPDSAPNNLTARLSLQQPPPKPLPSKPHVPQNKSVQPPAAQRPPHVSSTAIASPASAIAALSSPSSGASSPTIPSEPKAMKNAPTQPSFTKRALLARQKELEERIAKSKMELAAAAASKTGTAPVTMPITPRPQSPAPLSQQPQQFTKPAMDLGDKQAMEDRLRKLVLQSQKARGKPTPPSTASSTGVSSAPSLSPTPVTPSPIDEMPHSNAAQDDSIVTMSSFSLEDMAISFITQTIETIKAQPPSVPSAPNPPALALPPTSSPSSTPTPTTNTGSTATSAPLESAPGVTAKAVPTSNNGNDRERQELAAKQRRLEMHISESKALMARLSQARNKEEKDSILRVMREKSRLFEENRNVDAHQQPPSRPTSTVPAGITAKATTTSVTGATIGKLQSTSFQFSRLCGNQHDAGILILSDDSDDDDMEDDEG
ncbi:unnamed protein product [Cyclocybe aegerita]|uniref:Uncharacterized protein n=1 Tax=Cyclocybe aegerita TaxID=1973307 RepID=A0A8S0VSK1_CYCAE|nr:unnamed protein product [Cyclocybe aegerita]